MSCPGSGVTCSDLVTSPVTRLVQVLAVAAAGRHVAPPPLPVHVLAATQGVVRLRRLVDPPPHGSDPVRRPVTTSLGTDSHGAPEGGWAKAW